VSATAATGVEALVEVAAIERVKHRYLRLLDTKAFDAIGACFTEDATAAFSDGRHQLTSRDEIVAFFQRLLGSSEVLTNHRAHHPEIDLTGPDTAVGVWALDDEVIALDRGVTLRGTAFYEDTYAKLDGAWLISGTGYRRVYEEVVPRAAGQQLTVNRFVPSPPPS
jgi:hypothetical protein